MSNVAEREPDHEHEQEIETYNKRENAHDIATYTEKATVQPTNKFLTVQSKTFPRSCNLTKAINHW